MSKRKWNEVEHEVVVNTSRGAATIKLLQSGRTFKVLNFDPVDPNVPTSFAFSVKGNAQDLEKDPGSDVWQCFNLSTHIRIGDVVLKTDEMRAHCIEDLKTALKYANICIFDHEAI